MILLAIDTSGRDGSLALARVTPGQAGCEILEVVALAGGTFSAQLIPQVAALLEKHGFKKSDLAGFAAASGPGSFTGLRVGLAAIKALAEVTRKPIAAVSLLEAVARSSSAQGRVLAVLDAGRNQYYVGEYELHPKAAMKCERLLDMEELAAASRDCAVVTPSAQIASLGSAAGVRVEVVSPPRSDVIARLGWERILHADTVAPEALEANYIRRSDAEIFSSPKV